MNLIINPIGISTLYKIMGKEFVSKISSLLINSDKEKLNAKKEELFETYSNKNISLTELSAETNSIFRMKEKGIINVYRDIIYLLYSSTAEGYVCALLLKEILINELKFIETNVVLEELENLKVNEPDSFIQAASNLNTFLYEKISKKIENKREDEIIINITGGFKVLIPALTIFYSFLLESNYKANLCYIFENSEEIIQFEIKDERVQPKTYIDINLNYNYEI